MTASITRSRRWAATLTLIIAALASLATSQPVARVSTQTPVTFELSPERPIIARRVHVAMAHAGARPTNALLIARGGNDGLNAAVWVSLDPDDPAESHGQKTREYTSDYATVSLLDPCRADCSRTYVMVARMIDPADPPLSVPVVVDLIAEYSSPPPTGRAVSLEIEAAPTITEVPATVRAVASGVLEVTPETRQAVWRADLTVPAAAFAGYELLSPPIVGRVQLRGLSTVTGNAASSYVNVTAGAGQASGATAAGSAIDRLDLDWLASCTPGIDCVVPIEVTLDWSPFPVSSGSASGQARLEFELDFRLEYLDRASAPEGASLGVEPR